MRAFNSDTSGNNLFLVDDFNLGLNNLGLDVQLLEERCLLGIKTSGSSSDPHIIWGNSTNLGWGFSGFLVKDFLDFRKISIREDNTSVTLE